MMWHIAMMRGHVILPSMTVPVHFILAVWTGKHYSQMLPPHMGIQRSRVLSEISGTRAFFVSTQVDGGASMHGSLLSMNLEVHRDPCFLNGVGGLWVHMNHLFGLT